MFHGGDKRIEVGAVKRHLLAMTVAVTLTGCGKNAQTAGGSSNSSIASDSENVATAKRLVSSRLEGTPNPTMTLNSEDEGWNTVLRLRTRTVGWLRPNIGCGDGAPEHQLRAEPTVENYSGDFIQPPGSSINTREAYAGMIVSDIGLMTYKQASLSGSLGDKMKYTCQVYSDKFAAWRDRNSAIISGEPDHPIVTFGTRGKVSFAFQNEYKTDIPTKGTTTVVSLKFTYPMASNIPRLSPTSEGSGSAKLFYDNDSGQWSFLEFSSRDGDLSYSPSGKAPLAVVQMDVPANKAPENGPSVIFNESIVQSAVVSTAKGQSAQRISDGQALAMPFPVNSPYPPGAGFFTPDGWQFNYPEADGTISPLCARPRRLARQKYRCD